MAGVNEKEMCSKRKKIKISNEIQLLPSKFLLENLISQFKYKLHLDENYQQEINTPKGKFSSQDKRRSKSTSEDTISPNTGKERRRSNSYAFNTQKCQSKIVILQDIRIKPPLCQETKRSKNLLSNESGNTVPTEKPNSIKRVLLNLKTQFTRTAPNSVPFLSTTKFDFNNDKKENEKFYVKDTLNIDPNSTWLNSKMDKDNSVFYFKNKLYMDNQNVKNTTSTNVKIFNFDVNQNCSFNAHRTDNEKDELTSSGPYTTGSNTAVGNGTSNVNITSKKTKPKYLNKMFNIQIDENKNCVVSENTEEGTAQEEFPRKGTSSHKSNHHESIVMDISSKHNSSVFNEAFVIQSSISLDDCSHENYSPIVLNRKTNEIPYREEHKKSLGKIKKNNNILNLPYVGDIYSTEYLEDIFKHIRLIEKEVVLLDGFLNKHNPDAMCRSEIVNWMLKVQQEELYYSESEFYLAVNMLDRILANKYIPVDNYQLLALGTIWIAIKLIGSDDINVSTLIDISKGVYSKRQLLQMEQNILKTLNFELCTAEPSICIWCYLKFFNIEHNDLGRLSAFYVLDFFALLPEFSSTPMSILAATVINFVQNVYQESASKKVNAYFQDILSKEDVEKIKSLESILYSQLRNMNKENYIFKEAYRKYEDKGLMSISKYMHMAAFKYPT